MRIYLIAGAAALLVLLGSDSLHVHAQGESPYIYRIVVEQCQYGPITRTLTGFRLQGTAGIITALHGVADDCGSIEAKAPNAPDIRGLEIDLVDVRHDIAVLNLSSGEPLPAQEGLTLGHDAGAHEKISVRGHPYGITAQLLSLDLSLHDPPIVQMNSLLSGEVFNYLRERKSPDPTINVLSIEGDLLPGHSGAPIFNSMGEVIGVGNGGLHDSSITWAIPWKEVTLTSVKTNNLENLKGLDPRSLFEFPQSFTSIPPEEWLLLEITVTENQKSETIKQPIRRDGRYTYELVSQYQWPAFSSVIIKHAGTVIATGKINEWLGSQSATELQLQLYYCQVFLCLTATERSLHEIVFVDADTQDPIVRAKVTITWVDADDTQINPKEYDTDDRGKTLISRVPVDAVYATIKIVRAPCYDGTLKIPLSKLSEPIPITSNCLLPTWTPTPIPTSTPTPSFTPTPSATHTPTPSIDFELLVIVDGQSYDVPPIDSTTLQADPINLEAKGGSLMRIEIILEDKTHGQLSPGLATYHWNFVPPDAENASRVGTGNNILNYTVHHDRRGQLINIIVETANLRRTIVLQITIH